MLYAALATLAGYHGRRLSWRDLAGPSQTLPADLQPEAAALALRSYGFDAQVIRCTDLAQVSELPAIVQLKDKSWVLLVSRKLDHVDFQVFSSNATQSSEFDPRTLRRRSITELNAEHDGVLILAKPRIGHAPGANVRPGLRDHWFWSVFEKLRGHYGDCVIAAVLINLLGLAGSMFSMNVYDRIIPNAAMHSLWALSIGVLLAALFEFGLRSLRAHVLDDAGKRADMVISSAIYKKTLALKADQRPASSGQWAGQIREFESVRDFVSSSTLVALTDLPFVVLFLLVLTWMGGPLVLVPLVTATLMIVFGLLTQFPIRKSVEQYQYENSQKHAFLIESTERLETIEALGARSHFQGRWERLCAQATRSSLITRMTSALTVNFSQWIQQTSSTALIVFGVYQILAGQMTVGALIGCSILAGRALSPLGQVAALMARWQQTKTAFQTVDKLMALPGHPSETSDSVFMPEWRETIELRELEFTYPRSQKKVLDIGQLVLRRGERVAIVGPVGSGKSTLLRVLAGLNPASKGHFLADQLDLSQISASDWRAQVAWISQDTVLFRGTLRENLLIGNPQVADARLIEVIQRCGLASLIQQHPQGLDMHLGDAGQALSGGQRQLVALARALLGHATILLMDEPTSAMDMQGESALLRMLQPEFEGRLVVIATHRLAPLEFVNRLVVLDRGRIVADGPRDQVFKAVGEGRVARAQAPASPVREEVPA